jgi:P4 family phage/plasmid primase-like protien
MSETFDNKNNKYKNRVYSCLNKYRPDHDSTEKPTHLAYGSFNGKFSVPNEENSTFMMLYNNALEKECDVTNMSILETQKEYGPIIIDVDLEIPTENYKQERLYNNELIMSLASIYIDAINTYLHVPDEKCNFFLLEKKQPTEKEGVYKDGFHIMFPDLCIRSNIRHLIRYKVVKVCEEKQLFVNFLNGPEKIIDKAVVSTNAWFLYGSCKPNGHLYSLTKVFNNKLQLIYDHQQKLSFDYDKNTQTEGEYEISELVTFLSVQKKSYRKKNQMQLKNEYIDSDINAECEKLGINNIVKTEQFKYDIPADKEDIIRRATKFTSMLVKERSIDYHDWFRVGLALHNIDDSLLYTWIDFSKKCPRKYKDGECDKMWKTMKKPTSGNVLTIRSLAYWAKQDDPKQYEIFNREEFKNMMKKSLDGNTYYLAKSVHAKYSDKFVCSSIKNNIWWEFKHHRWNRIEDGYTLKILLSEDFVNEYNKEIADISIKATQISGFEKEELQQRRTYINKIVNNLMNTSFKNNLIQECTNHFIDSTFEQKLDSNIHLLGFENGVYDLEQGIFREGRPDDYITLSTKNDYYKWNDKNPHHIQIINFFNQVLPNKKVRDYFLNALCTCLSGETKEEKLYIMTGAGSNGKSLTMDLMYYGLGDYYMSCPITIITRKRGASNETSPEKVRMKGRRCGVFQETDDGEKLNVGVMKEFTGGDKVLVRDLFKGANEMIEFKPQMKYFLTCNQLPTVPSNDDGTWRRLRLIKFDSKFTDKPTKSNEFKIDTKLKQKIEQWGPAFISYLLHIFNTQYKGMTYLEEPDEVMASTNEYKMENDFYTEYINDRIVKTDNIKNTISIESIFEDFKNWYKKYTNDIKTFPKKIDIIKNITKILGEPNKKRFEKITFNINSDEESEQVGDLDS